MRALLSLVLLAMLPLASAVHTWHDDSAGLAGVSANGHGPWSHCHPAQETPCVACASAALFAPPATAAAAPTRSEGSERLGETAPERTRRAAVGAAGGRSPPVS